jgi:hypothetical protein
MEGAPTELGVPSASMEGDLSFRVPAISHLERFELDKRNVFQE